MVQALCRPNGAGPYSRSGSTKAKLACPPDRCLCGRHEAAEGVTDRWLSLAPSASNIKSAAANTHFVVGAERKRSCHQCGLLNRLTFTALPLRVLVCSA